MLNLFGTTGLLLAELIAGETDDGQSLLDLSLLGLVGTTFVITASYYQAYLVRQKGWGKAELKDGVMDARVGAIIMAMIRLLIFNLIKFLHSGFEFFHP